MKQITTTLTPPATTLEQKLVLTVFAKKVKSGKNIVKYFFYDKIQLNFIY